MKKWEGKERVRERKRKREEKEEGGREGQVDRQRVHIQRNAEPSMSLTQSVKHVTNIFCAIQVTAHVRGYLDT